MPEPVRIIQTSDGALEVHLPMPHTAYLENLLRKNCWPEIYDLFRFATAPVKELTESYSAYKYTKCWKNLDGVTVLHVGDGAHCRTAAMFAFLTKHCNVSIDPIVNEDRVAEWRDRHAVQRFGWAKQRWEEFNFGIYARQQVILTFTHAHVNSWGVVQAAQRAGCDVLGAYVSGCCHTNIQLTLPVPTFQDFGILSPQRTCQLWKSAWEGAACKSTML